MGPRCSWSTARSLGAGPVDRKPWPATVGDHRRSGSELGLRAGGRSRAGQPYRCRRFRRLGSSQPLPDAEAGGCGSAGLCSLHRLANVRRHPDSLQSWPGAGRHSRLPGSPWSGVSPATTAVRPCRTTIRPSSASMETACCSVPARMPWSALSSGIDGGGVPGRSTQPGSSTGPRTLRTCMVPSAGLIVRRIYLAALTGRQIPLGHLHILIEQLDDCRAPLRLAPGATCSSSLPRMFPAYAGPRTQGQEGKNAGGAGGLEPTTGGLWGARPGILGALPAHTSRVIAQTALTALGLSGVPVHEPVHGCGARSCRLATVRIIVGGTRPVSALASSAVTEPKVDRPLPS